MINALFLFNSRGDVLVGRLFKDGIKRNISDIFRIQVISNLDVSLHFPLYYLFEVLLTVEYSSDLQYLH